MTSPTANRMPEPEAIAADIEATRGRIDRTLGALAAKLSPRQMLSSAGDAGRTGLLQACARLQQAARERPIPLGVSAVTAILLALNSRRAIRSFTALARQRSLWGVAGIGMGALLGHALARASHRRSQIG